VPRSCRNEHIAAGGQAVVAVFAFVALFVNASGAPLRSDGIVLRLARR
jgi:hypothetical protein